MTEERERIKKANDKIRELNEELKKMRGCIKIAEEKEESDRKAYQQELVSNFNSNSEYSGPVHCLFDDEVNKKSLKVCEELTKLFNVTEAYSKSLEELRKLFYDERELKIKIDTLQELIKQLENTCEKVSELEKQIDGML